jgi:SPOR domain
MKNKRGLFSIILFLGVSLLLILYFNRDNTSKNINQTKAVSEDAQSEAQNRIDAFSNSNLKPSTNIITSADETATSDLELDSGTRALIAEEEALVRDCRGRSDGGSPETIKTCANMEVAFNKLIKLGLCYGENSETMTDKRWGKCKAAQKSSQQRQSQSNNDAIATEQELQAIKPYTYSAETLNNTCQRALNGTIEKIQVCNARDNAVERLKNYGWCWKRAIEYEPYMRWVKCDKPKSSNTVVLKNNSESLAQGTSFDDKNGETTSETLIDSNQELSKNQHVEHHFYIQIGIFSEVDNVKQLQDKLVDLGYKSQSEIINTDRGQKIRLLTQEFNDRNEASIALDKIKEAGLTGMVVSI